MGNKLYHEIDIDTLGGGIIKEKFDFELRKVLKNIQDPNSEAKKIREISIKIKILPSRTRAIGAVEISSSCKLISSKPSHTEIAFQNDNGRLRAYESNFDQPGLPGIESENDINILKENIE